MNFRIDFNLSWKKPFNKEARKVFIDWYFECVESGAFAKKPTPAELLTQDRIGDILDKQMPNYQQKWRRLKTPLSLERKTEIAHAACQRSHKRTIRSASSSSSNESTVMLTTSLSCMNLGRHFLCDEVTLTTLDFSSCLIQST